MHAPLNLSIRLSYARAGIMIGQLSRQIGTYALGIRLSYARAGIMIGQLSRQIGTYALGVAESKSGSVNLRVFL